MRVDPRSLEEQDTDREPEQHEGHAVTTIKRRSADTRIGEENEARQKANSALASQHMKALHELAKVEEERDKFENLAIEKRASLESQQMLTRGDYDMVLEVDALEHEERINAFYIPSHKAVQAKADRLAKIVDGRGILLTARRLWQGKKDRQELENLRATVVNTQQRMQEARAKIDAAQAAERARVSEAESQKNSQEMKVEM